MRPSGPARRSAGGDWRSQGPRRMGDAAPRNWAGGVAVLRPYEEGPHLRRRSSREDRADHVKKRGPRHAKNLRKDAQTGVSVPLKPRKIRSRWMEGGQRRRDFAGRRIPLRAVGLELELFGGDESGVRTGSSTIPVTIGRGGHRVRCGRSIRSARRCRCRALRFCAGSRASCAW